MTILTNISDPELLYSQCFFVKTLIFSYVAYKYNYYSNNSLIKIQIYYKKEKRNSIKLLVDVYFITKEFPLVFSFIKLQKVNFFSFMHAQTQRYRYQMYYRNCKEGTVCHIIIKYLLLISSSRATLT